jgi:O-acetyl-ADP-ribose deacetylase (regulator of RNase III)
MYEDGTAGEAQLLESCYLTCLRLGAELGVERMTFPAISTGIFGYPAREAADIAVSSVARVLGGRDSGSVREVAFILFGAAAEEAYRAAFAKVLGSA